MSLMTYSSDALAAKLAAMLWRWRQPSGECGKIIAVWSEAGLDRPNPHQGLRGARGGQGAKHSLWPLLLLWFTCHRNCTGKYCQNYKWITAILQPLPLFYTYYCNFAFKYQYFTRLQSILYTYWYYIIRISIILHLRRSYFRSTCNNHYAKTS